MKEEEFRRWLEAQSYDPNTITAQMARVKRLTAHYGNLGELGSRGLRALRDELSYSKEDERRNRPNPAGFAIEGSFYKSLASYRATLNYVLRFLNDDSDTAMTDDQLLARFDGSAGFRKLRAGWSPQQRSAFCIMARAVHDAGLDWYHTAIPQVRFGRKPKGAADARGTLGLVLRNRQGLAFSHQQARAGLSGEFAFDADGADAFAAQIEERADAITAWLPNVNQGKGRWPDEYEAEDMNPTATEPTNLILYGPPGTGKTYRTAREAVRLCDGAVDYSEDMEGRAALMARYAELVEGERIAFVTFHQNFSYEDFVEGLRPTQETDSGEAMGAGFRLTPEPGILARIAERAEVLPGDIGAAINLAGRRFFKMSLGEAANPEDDYLYDEAMEQGFVHLGGDSGMDWSADRFDDKDVMIAGFIEANPDQPVPGKLAGAIEFPHQMRNAMRAGDIVIISKGNLAFRAIGEITGPFHQVDRDADDYTMRRSVRWLWRDDDGLRYDIINTKRFSQRTVYEFVPSQLKLDALASLLGDGEREAGEAGKPYVLIIDEINRANVSKVFGELITLIEPDKRLGQPNALKVQLPYSKREFGVPANLHIIGTMNTADRSIALLDTALRRRFRFEEITPDPALLETVDGIDLSAVLATMNERIEYLHDREHRIGHAFFMGCNARADVDAVMRDKVLPLLQEYFFEDWGRIAAVVGGGFVARRKLPVPPGIEAGEDRISWSVRDPFADDAYAIMLGKGRGEESGQP